MNAPLVIDAGRFNRQLSVEKETEIADGMGGFAKQYQPFTTVWASICPKSAREFFEADNVHAEITHQITIRFLEGIAAGARFVTGSRVFEIISIHDADETRRYLTCNCRERR